MRPRVRDKCQSEETLGRAGLKFADRCRARVSLPTTSAPMVADIDDGARLGIRPFLAAELRTGGRKGTGICRGKPGVHWRNLGGAGPAKLGLRADQPWLWKRSRGGTPIGRTDLQCGPTFDPTRWKHAYYINGTKRSAQARALQEAST